MNEIKTMEEFFFEKVKEITLKNTPKEVEKDVI